MSKSSFVEGAPRVAEEEWRAVLVVARELAEKVSGLSHRLAVVEQQLNFGDRRAFARPWTSDR